MQFRAPLIADGYAAKTAGDALLVYLRLDGVIWHPLQWPALHDAGFDVRCASIDEDDRSTLTS